MEVLLDLKKDFELPPFGNTVEAAIQLMLLVLLLLGLLFCIGHSAGDAFEGISVMLVKNPVCDAFDINSFGEEGSLDYLLHALLVSASRIAYMGASIPPRVT